VIDDDRTYRLVHRPDLDATGYALGATVDAPVTVIDRVSFAIADPSDEHEATLALTLSRAAWESQGSPEELRLRVTGDLRRVEP
jgi:hypothetical protein